jgi:hypothetical protein
MKVDFAASHIHASDRDVAGFIRVMAAALRID